MSFFACAHGLCGTSKIAFFLDVIKDNVVPLVCQYCENGVHKQDASLIDIAENFGKFCHTFAGSFCFVIMPFKYLTCYLKKNFV